MLPAKAQWLPVLCDTQKIGKDGTSDVCVLVTGPEVTPLCRLPVAPCSVLVPFPTVPWELRLSFQAPQKQGDPPIDSLSCLHLLLPQTGGISSPLAFIILNNIHLFSNYLLNTNYMYWGYSIESVDRQIDRQHVQHIRDMVPMLQELLISQGRKAIIHYEYY